MNNKFYVYALLDPRKPGTFRYEDLEFDYEPFYIGKGSGQRIQRHYSRCEVEGKTRKNNKIIKLKNQGLKYNYIILKEKISENKAFQLEIELIKSIGRLDLNTGPLTNADDGGIGTKGRVVSFELRDKISNKLKGKFKGRQLDLDWKKKISLNSASFWSGKHLPKDSVEKTASKNRNNKSNKTIHYILINPDGIAINIKDGLEKFCQENNLQRSHLISVAKGKRNHHKGWKCSYGKVEEKHPSNLCNLRYILTDSDGNTIYVKDIKSFAKNKNLRTKRLYECARGKRTFHKGWKCSFAD
ncbi:MAG: GIY-YIG nuclease family protein [Bacteroidetes bacterium]|nr:GIY-YIG nuclease family protein [Bacteroidota bacterium]